MKDRTFDELRSYVKDIPVSNKNKVANAEEVRMLYAEIDRLKAHARKILYGKEIALYKEINEPDYCICVDRKWQSADNSQCIKCGRELRP